jgi:hypothetical protein
MSGATRPRQRRDLLIAVGAAVVVAVLLSIVLGTRGCGPTPSAPPADIQVTWSVTPSWSAPPAGAAGSPARTGVRPGTPPHAGDLALFLDISRPMGGFISPTAHDQDLFGYRSVIHLVESHLVSVAGTAGSRPVWYSFAAEATALPAAPRIERKSFTGLETRLDRALDTLTRGIADGRFAAAALVTDLNASGSLSGATGALLPLVTWLQRADVRDGTLHAGLLGLRANYWGVPGPGCPVNGDLRCWYSESLHAYRPLTHLAQAPFYVLILGRGAEVVNQVGARVLADATGQGLHGQWELLTAASLPRTVSTACHLAEPGHADEPQLALTRDEEGRWQCVQPDTVEVTCALPADLGLQQIAFTTSWPPDIASVKPVEPRRLQFTLDCARLRTDPPAGELILRLDGAARLPGAMSWQSWSSPTDETEADLGRTPQLADLVDAIRLRPARLAAASSSLLRMGDRAPRR